MQLSRFGQRFARPTGARLLMEDLAAALAGGGRWRLLGGGNPAHIPEVERRLHQVMRRIVGDAAAFGRLVGDYPDPRGDPQFRRLLAQLLAAEFGWPVTERNVVLTAGSQSAFFMLFNLFAGPTDDGLRRVLLPLTPEYIGYADVGIAEGMFRARRSRIELLDEHLFKYRVDLDALADERDIGIICVSRPTNPTGNVVTDDEVRALLALAERHDVPLVLDSAYGAPFPNIIHTPVEPIWDERIVTCLSLSKLGMPGVRTGIVVASEAIADLLTGMNAVLNLAVGSVGAALGAELAASGELLRLSREVIAPYYRGRAEQALEWVHRALAGCAYRVHRPEGAFFLWLWLPELPISTELLYRRLRDRGVLVLPGHYFFPGLGEPWAHREQCLRLSYTAAPEEVRAGIAVLGEEVRRAMDERGVG